MRRARPTGRGGSRAGSTAAGASSRRPRDDTTTTPGEDSSQPISVPTSAASTPAPQPQPSTSATIKPDPLAPRRSTATPTPAPSQAAVAAAAAASLASSPFSAVGRGSGASKPTRGPSGGRFKPKVVRRDAAERDEMARKFLQEEQNKLEADRRAKRRMFRGRRGRGSAMGRGGFTQRGGMEGGFGSFADMRGGSSRGGRSDFGGGGGGGRSGGGGDFKFGGKFGKGSGEDGKPYRPRETRINADRLNVYSAERERDSDDDDMDENMASRQGTVWPMGIFRRAHKEIEFKVATTAELEQVEEEAAMAAEDLVATATENQDAMDEDDEEDSLWVGGSGPEQSGDAVDDDSVWHAARKNHVKIKSEPGLGDDQPIDFNAERKGVKEAGSNDTAAAAGTTEKRRLRKAIARDPEDEMLESDLQILAEELGAVTIEDDTKPPKDPEAEKDTESPETEEEKQSDTPQLATKEKDGRLYMFQFPPLLPPLRPVRRSKKRGLVKSEPGTSDDSMDITGDLGEDNNNEDDQDEDDDNDEEEENTNNLGGLLSQRLPKGGFVGKLQVRKSGRVELDWGGMLLELNPATGVQFITTAVVVAESDAQKLQREQQKLQRELQAGGDDADGGAAAAKRVLYGGECVGMGKVMGRFVAAPVFDQEEDWTVDPAELEYAEA